VRLAMPFACKMQTSMPGPLLSSLRTMSMAYLWVLVVAFEQTVVASGARWSMAPAAHALIPPFPSRWTSHFKQPTPVCLKH
jgi:hypothetical protein